MSTNINTFLFLALVTLSLLITPSSSLRLEPFSTLTRRSPINAKCIEQYQKHRPNPLPSSGYFSPLNGTGGSMITVWRNSKTLGEPINAIISAKSSPQVLCPDGFLRYVTSINFGVSCLGNTRGAAQWANLGDGYGLRIQGTYNGDNGALRWNYGNDLYGTCQESIQGGNHFRWFLQNGTDAFSGAIFLAASMEETATLGHMIQLNGYNLGRDYLVGNATMNETTSWKGYTWKTTVEWVPAGILLNATSDDINHPEVALPGQPVQDGRVAVLTVEQITTPKSDESSSSSSSFSVGHLFSISILFLLQLVI